MFNRKTRDLYPAMCEQLEALMPDRLAFGRPHYASGLRIMAGGPVGSKLVGDGREYSQFDYPILQTAFQLGNESNAFVQHKRIGNFREMSTKGNVVVARLGIDDGDHPLAVDGKGWHVTYYFEYAHKEGREDFVFP